MPPDTQTSFGAFCTPVQTPRAKRALDHAAHIISIGSCFSEHVAGRLAQFHFSVCANPSGILYNPLSISSQLRRVLSAKPYGEDELFSHDGLFHSFDHHSDFSAPDAAQCLERINRSFAHAAATVKSLDALIVTFGTAFAYRLAGQGRLVTNCHKLPHDRFKRDLLPIAYIVDDWLSLMDQLLQARPSLGIILTVSPVRHLRDNAHENQVSKSHLLAAVYELEKKLSQVHYFPAYEIMMDELRDYRFYDDDMVHPSPLAVDYIWQRFVDTCVAETSREFIRRYAPIVAARNHRIRNASADAVRSFAAQQLEAVDTVQKLFPEIPLAADKEYFAAL